MDKHEQDIYDLGLAADLEMLKRTPTDRRRILKMGALGIGLLLTGGTIAAQQGGGSSVFLPLITGSGSTPTATPTTNTAPSSTATPTATTSPVACVDEIPQETAGPYPADGSNASNQSLNALALSGIVRSDLRTSIGTSNVAPGIPCRVVLNLVNSNADCAPLANYAVYIWHCTRDGKYSLYSNGVTGEDYLRGVQAAAADGSVTFTTIFPACYAGRWPHMHFEVYPSLATATSASNAIHTSQLALPEAVCDTVYATDGYSTSVQNMAQLSLATDNVFRDGSDLQLAAVTGDVSNGYTVRLTVGVGV